MHIRTDRTETQLREFAARHIPELASDKPWTPAQTFAILELHQTFDENGGHWRCGFGDCNNPADRFAEVCADHRDEDDEPIRITWDAIGVRELAS